MVTDKNTKAEIWEEYTKILDEAKSLGVLLPERFTTLNLRETKSTLLDGVTYLQVLIKNQKKKNPEAKQMNLDEIKPKEKAESIMKEETKSTSPGSSNVKNDKTPKQPSMYADQEDELKLLSDEIKIKIKALEDATSMHEEEFRTLQVLEADLASFAARLNADKMEVISLQKSNQETLNEEIAVNESRLDEEKSNYENMVLNAQEDLQKLNVRIETEKAELAAERAKETEIYDYELKIKESREDDQWHDRASKKEIVIKSMKDELEILKLELAEKEKLVPDLTKNLDELPQLLEKARQEGAKACKAEMDEENAHSKELFKREGEAAYQALELQLKNLKLDNEELLAERDVIQTKLDKAYEESNKLYLQTVQSTGGIKILGGREKD